MKNNILFVTRFRYWLDHIQPSAPVLMSIAALAVGLLSGIGIWMFKGLIVFFDNLAFGNIARALSGLGSWSIALLPVAGGLVVGLLVHLLVGEERHHGVAGIMEAVALAGGRLRYQRVPYKAVASAISIGSGASVGPEDPSVQIGANAGSMLGQWLGLSDQHVRTLVAAGSAGGIAAAFNAPIAGVFFALEIVLGELGSTSLGAIVVAAVVSAVFTQAVEGAEPAFHIPAYAFGSPWELPLYLGLGLLAGPVAAVYIRALYSFQDFFRNLHLPPWAKPALAGLIVGIIGIFLPQIFGVGYQTIESILLGQENAFWLLVGLLAAKLIVTPVSIGGGFQGGVFAPSLFLGASLGGAFGLAVEQFFPNLGIQPPAFAMVGMAAVLAGAVQAPLTAILLLFEMTHDYRIILPLMFSVAISLLIARRLQSDSVYILGLVRKGIRLERGRDVEVMEGITVGEVMQTRLTTLKPDDTLQHAAQVFTETHRHGLAVADENNALSGLLTIQDLDQALVELPAETPVIEICTRDPLVTYPDETMGIAMRRMGGRDIGRLPVVERDHPSHLIGMLSRTDIVRAYDIALSRRAVLRHRAHQVRLGAMRGEEVSVIEVTVQGGSTCAGKPMKAIAWPSDCIIASLRRGRRLMIPRGSTLIRPGDVLVAVVEGSARHQVYRLCSAGEENNNS